MKTVKLICTLLLLCFINASAQLPYKLIDGRTHKYCEACNATIQSMPPEVQFGVQINADGDIYFSMSNKQWFDKIFKSESYGISIDVVSKDRYSCRTDRSEEGVKLPMGSMTVPIYRSQILKGNEELVKGQIFSRVGKIPPALKGKQLEGNLAILNGNYICWYTNFLNIDRSVWQLLAMGFFTDSLLRESTSDNTQQKEFFTYTKKMQLEIPFAKGSTEFSNNYLKSLYDSLGLAGYRIQKAEIRAYSSVEGSEKTNQLLMSKRADAIVAALKPYQKNLSRIKVIAAENWLDFFRDIEGTKFNTLTGLSKVSVKQKLSDPSLAASIEPLLAKERKAVVTIYLSVRSAATDMESNSVLTNIQDAISSKDITKAREFQKELAERIIDKSIPVDMISKVDVPKSKEFSSFLNDREVFKYILKATSEYEALENFLTLKKLDPDNGRINYNICVLRFFTWQYGADSASAKVLLKEINALSRQSVSDVLVKRLFVNYHILKCEDQMAVNNYAGKDSSLSYIRDIYNSINANDEDVYSIAKYYAFYAHTEWAEEIIAPRITRIDVSEDLVFYYLNLLFFHPTDFDSDGFHTAALNAINLNPKRFCNFFLPNYQGGAGMQLLEYSETKQLYCENCK